jgi:predicted sulfurtransferase
VNQKSKEVFRRLPMMMEHRRGGGYISKQGMNACVSSNHKALHIYFDLLQEKKILNEIQQDYGQRKNH